MNAQLFRRLFLLIVVIGITTLFVYMIRGFLVTILLAAIFSSLLIPVYRVFLRRFRGRRTLASATTTLLFCLVVLVPVLGFLGLVASQAVSVSTRVAPWVEQQIREPGILFEKLSALPGIQHLEPFRDHLLDRAGQAVAQLGEFLFHGLQSTTVGTVSFLFQFFLFLYSIFFFLMDGEAFLRRMLYYAPMTHEQEMRMLHKFTSVTKATIRGTLLIGVLQGGLAGAALGLAGIHGWVFYSAVMMLLSIIPGVGVALVWVPAVIYLFAVSKVLAAILVTLWCALVVGSIDNVLRPRLVGHDTELPDLLILFSTLGGLSLFGVAGFLIGPIIAAIFVTLWDIYSVVYKDALPEVGSLDD